jgi:hypothetical protein
LATSRAASPFLCRDPDSDLRKQQPVANPARVEDDRDARLRHAVAYEKALLESLIVDDQLQELQTGSLRRFGDFASAAGLLPRSGAGIYTIWDDAGKLIYVGIAGRNPEGSGLVSRLRSHASGRRSGDQFCVYVADHYVLPELKPAQIKAISDGELSMDSLVRDYIRERFAYRFAVAATYPQAMSVENAIKAGGLGTPPQLNPTRAR